jgi:lysophospholipase L1-like esterase
MNASMKSRKALVFRLLFVLMMVVAVVAFFGLAEIVVRILWGDEINLQYTSAGLYKERFYSAQTDGWMPNAEGSSCGKPVKINSLGLRGPEIDLNSDKKKILLLGDSVLFGIAMDEEETISALLRNKLDSCIINTAVIGYATQHYVDVLRHWMRKSKLDRVMVFFCLNDIHNRADPVYRSSYSNLTEFILTQLRSRSKFYMLMKNVVSDRSKVYFLFSHQAYKAGDPDFVSGMNDLLAMKDMCDTEGIRLDVFILPYEYQLRNRGQRGIWTPQEMMGDFLKQQGIDFLMVDFPGFEGEVPKKLYLYADGIHFSALGHRMIAEEVSTYLSRLE